MPIVLFGSPEKRRDDLAVRLEIAKIEREIRNQNSDIQGFWQKLFESASEQGATLFVQTLIYTSGFLMIVGPLSLNVLLAWTGHPVIPTQESSAINQTGRDVLLISIGVKGAGSASVAIVNTSKKKKDDESPEA